MPSDLSLHEQVAERRVLGVVAGRRENDLGVARDLEGTPGPRHD